MKYYLCVLLLVLGIQVGGQNPAFDKINRFLSTLEQEHQFSGSILVAWKGALFKQAYGLRDREKQLAFEVSTVSCIGSVTKQFTGAAILKLEMQGKLKVEDPITKYFPNVPEDKRSITLHHLLTHSAGFPGAIGDDYASVDARMFVDLAMKEPLLFVPGSAYEYSNVGYSLLGIIIEQVSKGSYEAYLNQHLFRPAGMKQTGYVLPKWNPETVATGYRGERNWGKISEKNWASDGPYWHLRANGGILSTVEDLYTWHQALLGNTILNAAAKAKYYTRHIEEGPGAGSYYGYGWAIFPTPRQTTLIAHNGGNGIYFCDFLRYIDEDLTVIFLTNATQREYQRLATQCARACLDPNFTPQLELKDQGKAVPLDQVAEKALIQGFLSTITSGEDQSIRAFIENTFAPGFKSGFPIDQHLKILKQLGGDLKGLELATVNVADGAYELGFTGSPIKVILRVEQAKIGGILVE